MEYFENWLLNQNSKVDFVILYFFAATFLAIRLESLNLQGSNHIFLSLFLLLNLPRLNPIHVDESKRIGIYHQVEFLALPVTVEFTAGAPCSAMSPHAKYC